MNAPRSTTGADRGSDGSRQLRRAALLVVLVAVAVRALALWRVPELTYDGTYYLRQAERLAHFQYDWTGFPPGYPLAVALVRLVARDTVLAARLVSVLAGLAGLYLAHRLARRHLGPALALLVAGVLAVHPHLVRSHVETMTESLYGALVVGGVLAFTLRRDLLAGIALGSAFLVRPEAALVHAGLLALRAWQERRVPWALGLGLVPVAAYAAIASHAVGHFVVSPKQGQLDLGPALLARLEALGRNAIAVFPAVLLPGALVYAWRGAPHLGMPLVYVLTIPLFAVHVQPRLLVPALPFLLVLGVAWAARLGPRWRQPVGVAAVLLGAAGAAPGARDLATGGPLTPRARQIGAALRPHLQPQDRVAGRFPTAPYFAGCGFVRAPREASCTTLLDSVLAAGATHLLVLENEMPNVLPQLRALFEDARFATSEGRLVPVATVDAPPGSRAILYGLTRPAIEPATVRRLSSGIVSSAWVDGRTLAATSAGTLVWLPGGDPAPRAPAPVGEIAVDSAGTRAACTLGEPQGALLACLDLASGAWTRYPATALEAPASPCFAGSTLLYVSQRRGALRALDLVSGTVRAVVLEGVTPALATPERVSARGSQVAITYVPAVRAQPELRVVATAILPAHRSDDPLPLIGRWATSLRLHDPATCWSADGRQLVASVLLSEPAGAAAPERSSLCLLEPGGFTRRLSYGIDRARAPQLGAGRIQFLAGEADLCAGPLPAAALVVPKPRTFAAVLAPVGPPPR